MIVAKSLEEADWITFTAPGAEQWKRGRVGDGTLLQVANFFGSVVELTRGPQAFLSVSSTPSSPKGVDANPHAEGEPHFHAVDQFLVFVRGSGNSGKHSLRPVTIQYTDALVPYGPFHRDAEGLAFFNLRPRADLGAHFMPASADELPHPPKPGRYVIEHTKLTIDGHESSNQGPIQMEALIPPHEDGLELRELVIAANSPLFGEVVGGGGQYQLVLAGSMILGEESSLPAESCVWASVGERLTSRRAGPVGLHLLELQLPTA